MVRMQTSLLRPLSMAGGFITDLKIGYWLGSTPAKQEAWKFLGTIVSAATVGGVMIILNKTYGFTSGQLAAPQANAMAAVIEPLMNGRSVVVPGVSETRAVSCPVNALMREDLPLFRLPKKAI